MIFNPKTLLGSGLAVALLGGCLGTDNPDFNSQAIQAIQFVNGLEQLPATTPGEMPMTGSATYDGVAAFRYDDPISSTDRSADLFADMSLTADFDGNDVSGTISNFNSPNGNVSGIVDITDGAIASNLMQANAAGTIVDGEDTFALTLDIAGQFRGDDATAITGAISGSYTPEGGDEGDIFGTFGADLN